MRALSLTNKSFLAAPEVRMHHMDVFTRKVKVCQCCKRRDLRPAPLSRLRRFFAVVCTRGVDCLGHEEQHLLLVLVVLDAHEDDAEEDAHEQAEVCPQRGEAVNVLQSARTQPERQRERER